MKEVQKNKTFEKVISFGSETSQCFARNASRDESQTLSLASKQVHFSYPSKGRIPASRDSKTVNRLKKLLSLLMKTVKQLKGEFQQLKKQQKILQEIVNWKELEEMLLTSRKHERIETAIDQLKESAFKNIEEENMQSYKKLQFSTSWFSPPNIQSLNTSRVNITQNLQKEVKKLNHLNALKERENSILKDEIKTIKEFSTKRQKILRDKLKVKEQELSKSIHEMSKSPSASKNQKQKPHQRPCDFAKIIKNKRMMTNTLKIQTKEPSRESSLTKIQERKEKSDLLQNRILLQRKRVEKSKILIQTANDRKSYSREGSYERVSSKIKSLESKLKHQIKMLNKR